MSSKGPTFHTPNLIQFIISSSIIKHASNIPNDHIKNIPINQKHIMYISINLSNHYPSSQACNQLIQVHIRQLPSITSFKLLTI